MTYPQYQPQYTSPPPAAPQPQYGQPYPGVPQQAAPPAQPQQPAPQQGGQTLTPPVPQLIDGGMRGGTPTPKMRHLLGRTIIVEPKRVEQTGMKYDDGLKKEVPVYEAYFDLTVVDGGPLQYGDNQDRLKPENNRPNTFEIDTPCRFTGCNDNGWGFVQVVRDALDKGEYGRTGVVEQGTQGRRPYLLSTTTEHLDKTPRPDGAQRFQAAMAIFEKLWADKHAAPGAPRQFVSPEPRSLVQPSPAAGGPQGYPPPQVNYGAPAQQPYTPPVPQQQAQPYGYAAQQYAANGTVPTPYGSAPAAQVHPEYAHAATGGQAGYAPQPAPNGYYMPPQQPAAPAAEIPAPVAAWIASFPPEQQEGQRQAYLASVAGQQPQGAPAAGNGPGI